MPLHGRNAVGGRFELPIEGGGEGAFVPRPIRHLKGTKDRRVIKVNADVSFRSLFSRHVFCNRSSTGLNDTAQKLRLARASSTIFACCLERRYKILF